jgi:hypothetical protein
MRSSAVLMNDPISGEHIPYVSSAPGLFDVNGAPQGTPGGMATTRPMMLPTLLPPGWVDYTYLATPIEPNPAGRTWVSPDLAFGRCSYPDSLLPQMGTPNVRLSFDDPSAQASQDWTVTYEGVLPSLSGVVADMVLDQGGQTMTLYASGGQLCSSGVEDWQMGQARVAQLNRELAAVGLPVEPADRAQWTADYIEITDDLLDPSDGYWSLPPSDAGASQMDASTSDGGNVVGVTNECWDGDLANASASVRYNFCLNTFGTSANADTYLLRDFPILEANDNYLRVGRFGWVDRDLTGNVVPEASTNRVVVAASDTNKTFFHQAQCCFHHQAGFKVRAGGEWLTVGSSLGLLHHEQGDPSTGQCFQSPDPRLALMNARAFDLPWANPQYGSNTMCAQIRPTPFFRGDPLAMRNPLFSFVMWSGCGNPPGYNDHTLSQRDQVWRFSVAGGYSPITISLWQGTTTAVSPQSMRFIPSLGQLAVVDSEAQGLVLIDLYAVAFSHAYF